MKQSICRMRLFAHSTMLIALAYSMCAAADDLVSISTGGYATGLRTAGMMHIIDADGDGMISRMEWDAYQKKVFEALDTHKKGRLSTSIFASRSEIRLGTSLATGGYARGLESAELAHKIDMNGDGWITQDEWMNYQGRVFESMNTSVVHKDMLGPDEIFATGGR